MSMLLSKYHLFSTVLEKAEFLFLLILGAIRIRRAVWTVTSFFLRKIQLSLASCTSLQKSKVLEMRCGWTCTVVIKLTVHCDHCAS